MDQVAKVSSFELHYYHKRLIHIALMGGRHMLHRIELTGWSPTQLLSNSCTYGKRKAVAVFSCRLVPFLLSLFIGTTLSSPFSHPGGAH